jgi:hypothetical protein
MIDILIMMTWMILWICVLMVSAVGLLHLFHVLYTKEKDGNNQR